MKSSIFLMSIIVLCLLIPSCKFDEIKENKGVTVAQITGNRKDYRAWVFYFNYSYTINGNVYTGESGNGVNGKYLNDFMYKYFPIVYSKKNPEKSILLVTPADFQRWGMQFPDSLNWVKYRLKH